MKDAVNKKFPLEDRTFKTRLLFIKYLFENTYEQSQILASCINHKLDRSLQSFLDELAFVEWKIQGEDPLKILKKID